MNHPEDDLQENCVSWFRLQYPGRIIFAIPNGGNRGFKEAVRFKAQGVLSGILDLCVPHAHGGFFGLYVEMKAPKGRVSPSQKDIIQLLRGQGYCVEVCWSFEDFVDVVRTYLGSPETRAG